MNRNIYLFLLFAAAGCHHSESIINDQMVAIQIHDRNGLTETISSPDRLEVYEQMDFLNAQPYKKILRVYKKEGKNHSKITTYHPNGALWQYLEAKEMRANGAYREWFPNGQLKIDAFVVGGTADVTQGSQQDWLFDGISQVWNEKGELLAKIPYKNGVLEGTSTYYYPDSKIEKELPFSQNTLQGIGLEYHPNGKLKSKTTYNKGLKDGTSLGFFSESQAAWIEEHAEGLIKTATYYFPNGEVLAEIQNGGGFMALFEGQVLTHLIEIRKGRPEGKIQKYAPTGEPLSVYSIKNGNKEGEEVEYFLPTERTDFGTHLLPKLSVNWHENSIHGNVKTWYSNGQLQSQRDYCRNQKLGPTLAWYIDGSLMLVEEYEEDRLIKGQYYKRNQREPVSSVINGNGIASLYDEQGIFLRKVPYIKGKPVDPEK